jgi:hypothetical protein
MREHAKVAPQFWTGETARQLRKLGRDAQVVASYLITCPSSTSLGLYYLPIPILSYETGIPLEGASEALQRVSAIGFCSYDQQREVVFVHQMAKFQLGNQLHRSDHRVKWIRRELSKYANSRLHKDFVERYETAFHLKPLQRSRGRALEAPSLLEAPSKVLTCTETETDINKKKVPKKKVSQTRVASPTEITASFERFWAAYPRHVAKLRALKTWRRLKPDAALEARILVAVQRDRRGWTDPKFIPHAATWLNDGRWDDEPIAASANGRQVPPPSAGPRVDDPDETERKLARYRRGGRS